LFLNFHHGSPKLDPFIEILEDLLLDGSDVFLFVDPATVGTDTVVSDGVFAVPAFDPGQFILVFDIFSVF
jgi:hypothetical protein